MTRPEVVTTVAALRARLSPWRRAGERVAMVPTMGALHAGHLRLVAEAEQAAERVVVSIFVNPTQFAPNEDLAIYPRDLPRDLDALSTRRVDLVFAPEPSEMYPPGASTVVSVGGPAEGLESVARPHFFAGVATVVAKLLIQCGPDVAFFGEKDFQQLAVVRRMVADLAIPTDIRAVEIVRESDGLAMSSRNVHLKGEDRTRAAGLHRALAAAAAAIGEGAPPEDAVRTAAEAIAASGFSVDYVELRDAATLAPVAALGDRPARLLAAARIAGVRLIDNVAVTKSSKDARFL